MNRASLADLFAAGRFVVTSELTPPKGTDLRPLLKRAGELTGSVDAFNVTDSASARMSMSPIAAAHWLIDSGQEAIVQLTTRDRNRIALQSDILGAAALGVRNLLLMGGDSPDVGDHPGAKGVFDLTTEQLLAAGRTLGNGHDLGGQRLRGTPQLFIGAVTNPGAPDLAGEVERMRRKIAAGARFFQTQAVYSVEAFERFAHLARPLEVPILAGVIPLKTLRLARHLHDNVPGIDIPAALLRELADADDIEDTAIRMAGRIIEQIRPLCQGVHVMAIGWEQAIPAILAAAGVPARGS